MVKLFVVVFVLAANEPKLVETPNLTLEECKHLVYNPVKKPGEVPVFSMCVEQKKAVKGVST